MKPSGYNRVVTLRSIALVLGALVLFGCNRGVQTPEAVRQGVIDHLSKRSDLDIGSMQVDVTSVSFRRNEADATVSFRPKGGGPSSGMQMRYTLEQRGNRWVVKSKSEAGGTPHGAGARGLDLPPGHPPMTSAPQQGPPQSGAGGSETKGSESKKR